jgi:hypothetical protein
LNVEVSLESAVREPAEPDLTGGGKQGRSRTPSPLEICMTRALRAKYLYPSLDR